MPWKTEAEVYRSDIADRLPDGLTVPRALGVFDLDATSSSIWLEEVPARPATWDLPRYERAAYLLGRFSGSRALAPLAEPAPRRLVAEHLRDRPAGRSRWCRC